MTSLHLKKISHCLLFTIIFNISQAQLGVIMPKDINTNTNGGSGPHLFVPVSSNLFFVATNIINANELWKYNSVTGSVTLVKDINNIERYSSNIDEMVAIGGILFFNATDGTNGTELWKSDGTTAGTVMVKNIYPNSPGSYPKYLTNLNGTLVFIANDGTHGNQVWKSDGTSAGTVMISDLVGLSPIDAEKVENELFFIDMERLDTAVLYRTNGVKTQAVNGPSGTPNFIYNSSYNMIKAVNKTLFITGPGSKQELWKVAPNTNEITLVKDINKGEIGSIPQPLVYMNGALYFTANDGSSRSLWKSDGTEAGTVIVKTIPDASPSNLRAVNNNVYFTVLVSQGVHQLWKSDGTTAGTVLVKNLGQNANPRNLTDINGKLYFVMTDDINGSAIWRSDGTEYGTKLMYDVTNDNSEVFTNFNLTALNGMLCFSATDNVHGTELWVEKVCTSIPLCTSNFTVTDNTSEGYFFERAGCKNLVAKIAVPDQTIKGKSAFFKASVFKETTQPVAFVKRHYEIIPETGTSVASATITLYFTQQEFNDFNAANSVKLPTTSGDITGIANLQVALYPDLSKKKTVINPDDKNVVWNAAERRWEISFTTTEFGGFKVQSKAAQ